MFRTNMSGLCKPCRVTADGLGDEIRQMYGGQSKIGGYAKTFLPAVFPVLALNMKIPVLGPMLEKIFGGLFKKATKMESCMKWWSDENIRGMVTGVQPYPIDIEQMLPEIATEYRLQHARSINTDPRLANILSFGARNAKIQNAYLQFVRGNPDIMGLQCAVQNSDETGLTEVSQAQVNMYWKQLQEAARQQEVYETANELEQAVKLYVQRIEKRKTEIQESRSRGLITGDIKQPLLPGGAVAIKGSTLVLEGKKKPVQQLKTLLPK